MIARPEPCFLVLKLPVAKPQADYRTDDAQDVKTGMAIASVTGGYAMKEIAGEYVAHYSTVSCAVKVFEEARKGGTISFARPIPAANRSGRWLYYMLSHARYHRVGKATNSTDFVHCQ